MELTTYLQIAQLLFYMITGLYFVVMLKADIKVITAIIDLQTKRSDAFSDKLNILTEAFAKLAVQDTRIKYIEDDIKAMQHGKGFVTGPYTRHGSDN